MKPLLIALWAVILAAAPVIAQAEATAPSPVQKIALPGVSGAFDHLAIDAKSERLFVAATGANTIEVLDLKEGKPLRSIPGFSKPRNLVLLPDANKLYVSNGGTGEVLVVDTAAYTIGARLKMPSATDFMTYSPENKKLYVGYESGVGIVDTAKDAVGGDIKLDSAPESFLVGRGGATLFVNLPATNEVAVVDLAAGTVSVKWKLTGAGGNTPMALSPEAGYLMLGCRKPAKFVVLDMANGDELATSDADGGADDLFVDLRRDKVYMSCGDGFIDVFVRDGDGCKKAFAIPTRKGAKTSLFVRETGKYYVALPKNDAEGAEIWVFDFSK